MLFLSYLAAALFYFYVRWTSTLDIGWVWWVAHAQLPAPEALRPAARKPVGLPARRSSLPRPPAPAHHTPHLTSPHPTTTRRYASIILFIEIFTSTSTVAYAVLLVQHTKLKKTPGLPPRRLGPPPKGTTCYRFDVRVLVPCYKEAIEVVENTLRATLNADVPHNTTRTIYLCDDGADPTKEVLAQKLGQDVVYVTGRVREKGEVNGKSANLNHCLSLLYPKGVTIPNNEVLVVLDADMVPTQNFFTKILEVMQVGACWAGLRQALCCVRQARDSPIRAPAQQVLAWRSSVLILGLLSPAGRGRGPVPDAPGLPQRAPRR